MKRARDIRDQLEGLLERVEIDLGKKLKILNLVPDHCKQKIGKNIIKY